ncbi:MAG: T9SS type A sorting domain-containing protein, partial [Bacteroidetes bacterium]|nr:T9SS type A sorting domain-containing protein [Bacteroidota bacterium]
NDSRCQTSGSATAQISGGAGPYTYSITSGPLTAPPQSSPVFQSLPPGSYMMKVTDYCNSSAGFSFTIGGSYAVPQVSAVLQPPACIGGSDGSIRVDVTDGRGPFSYSLISPSPITAPDQPGNQFNGLRAGTYTYRVSDSCGNYQTRTVVLPDGDNAPFYIQRGDLHFEGCDSFSVTYSLYPASGIYLRPPYTVVMTLPNGGSITQTIDAAMIGQNSSSASGSFHFRYHHTAGSADNIVISAYNHCGASYTTGLALIMLDMAAFSTPLQDCSGRYTYTFDQGKDNNPSYPYRLSLHCSDVKYTLVSPAGVILATQINNSTFTGFPAGNGYKVVREDCCSKDSLYFNWLMMPALKINGYTANPGDVCKEGTTSLNLSISPVATGSIILASGPPAALFSDGTVHHYTYPDTIRNQPFGTTGVSLNYFTEGIYKLYAMDGCGQKDSITVSIRPEDLRHSTFTPEVVKGCTGANRIVLNASSNTGVDAYTTDAYIYTDAGGYAFYPDASPYKDSISNLSDGSWYVHYLYQSRNYYVSYLKGMAAYGCDMITDTLTIPAYTQPLFASAAAIAVCGATRYIALLPDSTRGLPPYAFQVLSGPVSTLLQPEPVFQSLPSGTYTFLMADACGNSYSRSMSIDTLSAPVPMASGSTCEHGIARLQLPDNPFYSYEWQRPDGSSSTGNTLVLNPVMAADTGTYTIRVTSSLSGCTDSSTGRVTLNYCSLLLLPVQQLDLQGSRQGRNILLEWQVSDETAAGWYVIERSVDGKQFAETGRVSATGIAGYTYTFTDRQPLSGVSYYRIRMVHTDGTAKYSRTLSLAGNMDKPAIYPTLISGNTPLHASWPSGRQPVSIQIVSMDGRVLLAKRLPKASLQTSIDTDILAPGAYLVVLVNSDGSRMSARIIRQ